MSLNAIIVDIKFDIRLKKHTKNKNKINQDGIFSRDIQHKYNLQ